ncbi:glucose-1-phosphate thymidylyltransferase [Streptomyces somaliensis]|uniref:glucose-1-phosphate thymidylyltransferase n=1 Tax=Streptomyces somaliensis TaxID=78355 RepID=UPI0020CF72EE|nr:glucose-1-phosphate thymidylyltransferase [Streptomyces somaliensis]MCP9943716.1 glucose-1-phosphate thymidylyltransferase [Streptomyces somaliensis]MCP9963037.1 glucose-1-phosphate thymidylyltransferase [Streptomyces somaliensis]MCP9975885.1 glucose-1-phosphate thymidylyltransferase [Streptomyces somaliensis]
MRALVLAGGSGTRLRPITLAMPKQLIPVGGRPVLFHCLDNIRAAGITEVGIVVGEWEDVIREAVGDGSAFGLRVTYLRQDAPRGLAHAVLIARDFLGDDDFVLYLGDNVLAGGIGELVAEFATVGPDAQLAVGKVTDVSEYGIATLGAERRVTGVQEKPQSSTSDLAVIGVYLFGPRIHEAVRAVDVSARGELEITDAIQWLISTGHDVRGSTYEGYWKDTGNADDLLECNRTLLTPLEPRLDGSVDAASELTGPVLIGAGARVLGSEIHGPAIVGPGSVVRDSTLGPFTTVGAGCLLEGACLDESIVLDGASVRQVQGVSRLLIGGAYGAPAGSAGAGGLSLVLGDNRVPVAHR